MVQLYGTEQKHSVRSMVGNVRAVAEGRVPGSCQGACSYFMWCCLVGKKCGLFFWFLNTKTRRHDHSFNLNFTGELKRLSAAAAERKRICTCKIVTDFSVYQVGNSGWEWSLLLALKCQQLKNSNAFAVLPATSNRR